MTHKEQLEQWWGEAADSFPGTFSEWLINRIETQECEDLMKDLEVLMGEWKNTITNKIVK